MYNPKIRKLVVKRLQTNNQRLPSRSKFPVDNHWIKYEFKEFIRLRRNYFVHYVCLKSLFI